MRRRLLPCIVLVALGGCRSHPAATSSAIASDKVAVLVSSKADPWIAKELKVIQSSPSFAPGLEVREATDTKIATEALTSFKRGGFSYVVVLAPEDSYDGSALAGGAERQGLRLISLHWRLFGRDGSAAAVPFVGIHQTQIGDALAQDVLKNANIAGAKCLLVGSQTHWADFFSRVCATLHARFDVSHAVKCDVPLNRPASEYLNSVLSSTKAIGAGHKWVVIGADDYCALGAKKALTDAGAGSLSVYGVGASEAAQKAWDNNDPLALDGTVLLNPYLEIESLAKVIRKWQSTGKTTRNVLIGGSIVNKSNYKAQIKNAMMPTGGDHG